ncbi:MAG: DUF1622 domain-containing protein [Dehalococcoidia bacterium]
MQLADFEHIVKGVGAVVEGVGVAVIVIGGVVASTQFLQHIRVGAGDGYAYRQYRRGLGRALLLGLEFLVAGDIIRTVTASPTLTDVAVLGGIVLIRTFLSVALVIETEGRLPWQPAREAPDDGGVRASK